MMAWCVWCRWGKRGGGGVGVCRRHWIGLWVELVHPSMIGACWMVVVVAVDWKMRSLLVDISIPHPRCGCQWLQLKTTSFSLQEVAVGGVHTGG